MNKKARKPLPISPRVRLYSGKDVALGPGKVELLTRVAESGSLSKAAREMKMSYMKAWLLVQVMNRCFHQPLVTMERGGAHGGRAVLTDCGSEVLALYKAMEEAGVKAMKPSWSRLQKLLRPAW